MSSCSLSLHHSMTVTCDGLNHKPTAASSIALCISYLLFA